MPKLTDPQKIEQLREKVATMRGAPGDIAAALNAPEVIGYETGRIGTADAYEAISPATMLALDTAAGGDGAHAGEAIWFLSALADVEPISLAEGGRGRSTLNSLAEAEIIPAAERDALMAAAQEEVLGEPWGMANGFGRIRVSYVLEVLSNGDSD